MITAKVQLKNAQKVKEYLLKKKFLMPGTVKSGCFVYFPIKSKDKIKDRFGFISFVKKDIKSSEKVTTLKQALKDRLSKKELAALKTAFDTIGSIAILEIDDLLVPKEKMIAKGLLNLNRNIKTVLKKTGIHSGVFRTQKLKFLAGKRTKEAVYKENNVRLKLNVETVYFSPRLSTERKRIASLIHPEESVLVMFSGCAPYPCVISRNTAAKQIVGIEINPEGHKYGIQNIELNKLKNVELFLGDVKAVIPKLKKKFDRILMPLPKSAEDFLPAALKAAKKGTIIHFYDFLNEKDFYLAEEKAIKACKQAGFKYKKLDFVKCGQHSPRVYRICLDFVVESK